MTSPTATGRVTGPGLSTSDVRPGLSSLLERRVLRRVARHGIALGTIDPMRSLRVLPSGLDVELSHAIDVAACQHRPLVAILPLPLPAAPVAMAAAATVAAIAAAKRVQARTAVVSPRLAGRQMYDELLVDRERLSVLVPRTTVGDAHTGNTVVTAHDCAQLLALESLDALTGLVLDLTAADSADLGRVLRHMQHRSPRRPLLLLAIASSPLDPAVTPIREANGLVYAVDQQSLAEQAAITPPAGTGDGPSLVCGVEQLLRGGTAALEVQECGDPALDAAVTAMWAATAALGRTGATDGVSDAANLRWAWAVTSSFSLLATSAARVDHNAQRGPWGPPALLDASSRARDLAVSQDDSLWLRWAEAADAAVAASEHENKAAVVAQLAAQRVNVRDQEVVVLARHRAAAAALTDALLENPRAPANVLVASMRDYAASRLRIPDDALVVVTGPLPRLHAGWLCVPPAGGLILLTAGPGQTRRAAGQVIDARAALSRARRNSAAEGLLKNATAESLPLGEVPVQAQPVGPLAIVTVGKQRMSFEASPGQWDDQVHRQLDSRARKPGHAEAPGTPANADGLWSPFKSDALAALERCAGRASGAADQIFESDVEGGAGADRGSVLISSGAPVEVLPITLRPLGGGDERVLLYPPDEMVTRRDGLKVKSVAARALRANDLVALIAGEARQNLFEHMVENLEESPEWALPVRLARMWQRCVRRIPGSGMTYEEIRRRAGLSVSASAIGTWARGQAEYVLNGEDVRRLARTLNDQDVLSRADAVAEALHMLWDLHRQVGRWLSAKLARASRVGLGDNAIRGQIQDEVVDTRLGLRASDLLGSIRLYRVSSVGNVCAAPTGAVGNPLLPAEAAGLCMPVTDT